MCKWRHGPWIKTFRGPSLLPIVLCCVNIRCLPYVLPCALPASPPHPTNREICTGQFYEDCNTGCFPLPERTIQPPLLLSTSPCLTVHKNSVLKCKVSQVEAALCLLLLANERMSISSERWDGDRVELEFQLSHPLSMCPPAGHFPSEHWGPLDVQVSVSLLTVLRAPLASVSSSLALELRSLSSQRVPRGAEPVDTLAAGSTSKA